MAVTTRTWCSCFLMVLLLKFQIEFVQATMPSYRVTTIIEHPFTMISDDKSGGTKYQGFLIDVLMDLKQSLGIDFDIDLVVDGRYGTVTEEGNWTGLIGHLVRGEADVAVAPLTVTSKRAKDVDYTQPFMLTGPQILMKKQQPLSRTKFFMLLQPLSAGVWITALAGYVVVSVSLYVIWRWSPFEWGNMASGTAHDLRESFNIHNSFLFAFSTMLKQGYRLAPRSVSGRLLSAIWWIFAMFFLVAYTASLTGRFIIKSADMPNKISTFDDLALSSLSYGFVKGGSTEYLFKTSPDILLKTMWGNMKANPSNLVTGTKEGIDKVRKSNGGYAFIVETPMAEYVASKEPCDMYVTGERLTDNGYAFACKKGSGVCGQLNHAMLALKESTRLHDLRQKWFGGACARDKETKTKSPFVSVKTNFNLQDSAFAFLLLTIGIIVSFIVLGLEIFLNGKGIVVPSSGKEDEVRIHDPSSGM